MKIKMLVPVHGKVNGERMGPYYLGHEYATPDQISDERALLFMGSAMAEEVIDPPPVEEVAAPQKFDLAGLEWNYLVPPGTVEEVESAPLHLDEPGIIEAMQKAESEDADATGGETEDAATADEFSTNAPRRNRKHGNR